jgi:membrane glycosyltransferase
MTAHVLDILPEEREAPLPMPAQDLKRPFRDAAAPGGTNRRRTRFARLVAFGFPFAVSLALGVQFGRWFALDGRLSMPEWAIIALTAFTVFWVALSVATALLGLLWRPLPAPRRVAARGLDVAILLPMYGEPADEVIGNAVRLLAGLQGRDHPHRFSLHILSDSRSPKARHDEASALRRWRQAHPDLPVTYRWRAENVDFKSGNLAEWIGRQGGAHEAMLVLDADSVMGRDTVIRLAGEMAADASLGLIQTIPRLLPGRTVWQRMQGFAAEVYGVNLGRGFSLWAGREANFLGHNALVRTRAFAASAGLPHLPGRRPMGGVILSHDFVEAALLRRAGWGVRMLPEADESYEDTPENIPGYIKRDRRWCQGNMQHLRLLGVPGLNPMSRLHFTQGAMAYLGSLFWASLLGLWAFFGDHAGLYRYFSETNPVQPTWHEMPDMSLGALASVVLLLVIAPRLIGAAGFALRGGLRGKSRVAFLGVMLGEIGLSALIAPLMMVQHCRAVLRTFAGFDGGWVPHLKGRPDLVTLLRFHWMETAIGAVLTPAVAFGVVTPWLGPVAACLLASVPLSALVATEVGVARAKAAGKPAAPPPAVLPEDQARAA